VGSIESLNATVKWFPLVIGLSILTASVIIGLSFKSLVLPIISVALLIEILALT